MICQGCGMDFDAPLHWDIDVCSECIELDDPDCSPCECEEECPECFCCPEICECIECENCGYFDCACEYSGETYEDQVDSDEDEDDEEEEEKEPWQT